MLEEDVTESAITPHTRDITLIFELFKIVKPVGLGNSGYECF